jgi:hypothetical protein
MSAFLQAQTTGIDGGQTNLVTQHSDATKKLAHLLAAEDHGQLLVRGRTHDAEDGPVTIERLLVEEPDAANGDGHGVARVMFDVLGEKEVLPQFGSVLN